MNDDQFYDYIQEAFMQCNDINELDLCLAEFIRTIVHTHDLVESELRQSEAINILKQRENK